jgi:hypothetical protein
MKKTAAAAAVVTVADVTRLSCFCVNTMVTAQWQLNKDKEKEII